MFLLLVIPLSSSPSSSCLKLLNMFTIAVLSVVVLEKNIEIQRIDSFNINDLPEKRLNSEHPQRFCATPHEPSHKAQSAFSAKADQRVCRLWPLDFFAIDGCKVKTPGLYPTVNTKQKKKLVHSTGPVWGPHSDSVWLSFNKTKPYNGPSPKSQLVAWFWHSQIL